MMPTPYTSSAYITSIAALLVGAFVFRKKNRSTLARVFFAYSCVVALWAVLTATHALARSESISLICAKAMQGVMPFIPILFLHFVWVLLGMKKKRRYGIFLSSSYLIALFVAGIAIASNLFVAGVRPKLGFVHFMDPGPFYFVLIIFSILYSSMGLGLLALAIPKATGVRKNQLQYLFWGSLVGYVSGISNSFPIYNLSFFPYPYGSLGIMFYVFVTAYAIVKYKLLEVEVIVRKTIVFAGLLAFVFGVFSFGSFVSQEFLATYLGFRWEMALAVSIFLIVLGYESMRTFLIEITDRYLFQKKYDYRKLLRDAATGIAQIESLSYLLRLVVHFITMRVRIKNVAILTRDLQTHEFRVGCQRGYPSRAVGSYFLSARSALIRYLGGEKEPVEIEKVKEFMETDQRARQRKNTVFSYDFVEIKHQMEELRASCCIPSFLGRELRNVLILGEKKSGDPYSQEDLNVLFTLAQQSAIAIENARLYDEAINKSRELGKINQELENAKARLVRALTEAEKANKELQSAQALLILEQKMATLGRLAASVGHEVNNPLTILSMNVSRSILKYKKDPDLKVADILDLFQKMEQNIGRIKAVVNTLTGLLKKSEKGKFEPLSLKLILEETLPLVQFQTYLENPGNTEVEFDIPSSIPLVRGDLERLQEVFLNLFINAYHAMSARKNPRIAVNAQVDENNPRMIVIEFSDNGCGMAEEVQKKIFTYGFTTKGIGRGSGMGLYMCKYIIELHGGEIRVKSRPGVGTTFLLTLPVFEEASQMEIIGGADYSKR